MGDKRKKATLTGGGAGGDVFWPRGDAAGEAFLKSESEREATPPPPRRPHSHNPPLPDGVMTAPLLCSCGNNVLLLLRPSDKKKARKRFFFFFFPLNETDESSSGRRDGARASLTSFRDSCPSVHSEKGCTDSRALTFDGDKERWGWRCGRMGCMLSYRKTAILEFCSNSGPEGSEAEVSLWQLAVTVLQIQTLAEHHRLLYTEPRPLLRTPHRQTDSQPTPFLSRHRCT